MEQEPKEWFVFDGIKVSGPFNGYDVKAIEQKHPPQARRLLISRSGMKNWYPIEQFSLIAPEFNDQRARTQNTVTRQTNAIQVNQNATDQKHNLKPNNLAHESDSLAASLAKQTWALAHSQSSHTPAQATPNLEATHTKQRAHMMTLARRPDAKSQGHVHRLGSLKSPFFQGILLPLLSCGFSMMFWYHDVRRELLWHLTGQTKFRGLWPAFWVFIPGVHMLMFYQLALIINSALNRAHHRTCSPSMAGFLSLIPPLALIYLQVYLNHLWRSQLKTKTQTILA